VKNVHRKGRAVVSWKMNFPRTAKDLQRIFPFRGPFSIRVAWNSLQQGMSFPKFRVVAFQLGSYKIDLSHIVTDYQLDCSKISGGLILGVRPEDIYLDEHYSNAVAPSPKMAAQVKMVEYLGDSTIVHLEGDIGSFKSRFNKDLRVRKSENLDFVFDLKKLHLFTEEGNKLPC